MNILTPEEFSRHTEAALSELSPEIAAMVENVVIVVEDENPDEPDILGLYEGLPLTERDGYGLLDLPDKISIYRLPLCAMCKDIDELIREIRITVIHEIGHHFGIDDDRLHEMGWG